MGDNKGKDDFGAHKFIHGIYNTTTAGDCDWFEKEGENFALTFTSTLNESFTTYPIFVHDHPDMFGKQVELALKSLPNRVITDVSVTAKMGWLKFNHTADGMLSVFESRGKEDNAQIGEPVYTENLDLFSALNIPTECKDGCTPKLNGIHLIPFGPGNGGFVVEDTKADYNNYECGRRGKCDYETGECVL